MQYTNVDLGVLAPDLPTVVATCQELVSQVESQMPLFQEKPIIGGEDLKQLKLPIKEQQWGTYILASYYIQLSQGVRDRAELRSWMTRNSTKKGD